jgi:hypothetical protein
MRTRSVVAVAAAVVASVAGAASAGVLAQTIPNTNIFGSLYGVELYRVGGDLIASGGGPRLEPEGLAFHNGVLYASGDGPAGETNGFLAAYAGGNLGAAPTAFGRFTVAAVPSPLPVGGEGLAINTRGSGYGSFTGITPKIATVDNPGGTVGRILGVHNLSSNQMESVVPAFPVNSDDITFVPGAASDGSQDRFALINAANTPAVITWYSTANTPAPTSGVSFSLPLGAKGLTFIPAASANLFLPGTNQDVLLVASSPEGAFTTNRLTLFTLDGLQLGESVLPTGANGQAFGNVEALAFDPVTNRLFLGDETANFGQIGVIVIPSPASAGLLALGGLAALRRRR